MAALVWDGAPSHRDEDVHALGLLLIGLPPYSPELNAAERIFEELRRAIEGRVYPTLADKVVAVEAGLARLDADPARIRSLAGRDWIEATVQQVAAISAASSKRTDIRLNRCKGGGEPSLSRLV
ncbi:MAG: transposase [Chloroflexi bacterium]|nr:transposase [Chloroflexota bacterium]